MKLWTRTASTLLVVAALSAGQTPASDSPAAPAGNAPESSAAVSAPLTSSVTGPDTTAPAPVATPVVPAAIPADPALTTPAATTQAPAPTGTGSSNYRNPYAPVTGSTAAAKPSASPAKPATAASATGSAKKDKAGPAAAAAGMPAGGAITDSRYVLGPNDIVAVTVFDEPHLPGSYVIGPDGQMSMPLIGDFKAVGLTLRGLQDLITEKLKEYIHDPVVNVQLLRNNSKQYTVFGEVGRTGPFPLLRQTTILDALAACGGFKDFSNPKKIYLLRGTKKYFFNYKEVIQGKHMEQNIPLEDGDLIVVPE